MSIFIIGKRRGLAKPAPLVLCGHELPWVQSATHLGHELHESGDMDHDSAVKSAQFIDKSVEIRSMFGFAAPADVLQALKTYCSDFYGSMLWDLGGDKAAMVYSAWDTAVKLTWSCPKWTRTYILQNVLASNVTSAKTDILARYSKFCKGLQSSVCQEVKILYNLVSRDLQSTTARNLRLVRDIAGLDPRTACPRQLKNILHSNSLVDIPPQDAWRLRYLQSLLGELQLAKQLAKEDINSYIQGLINSLVM